MARSRRYRTAESPFKLTGNYALTFAGMLAVYLIFEWLWGDLILLSFGDLAKFDLTGLVKVWFIFAWAFAATWVLGKLFGQSDEDPAEIFTSGLWISLNAGVFEELIYRWLVFFSAMVVIPVFDWVIPWDLWRLLYTEILIPLANFTTFGALEPQLYHPASWVVGAAIVSASIAFRDVHAYLGLIGLVNSWFFGMVMFYLTFNYGILVAIIAHVLYDVIVFSTIAAGAKRRSIW